MFCPCSVIGEGLENALAVGNDWIHEKASVVDARNAAFKAHAVARESSDKTTEFVARSVGHAVATAHMADHSLGTAWYALKAVKSEGESVDAEKKWQNDHLPSDVKDLVLSARESPRFKKI